MFDIHQYEPLWKYWVVDEEIGTGTYGTTWKAHRVSEYSTRNQVAAIKHISIPNDTALEDLGGFSSDALKGYYAKQLERLTHEIEAMISLRGRPYIVSYEEHLIVNKPNGFGYEVFIRMELLDSLTSYIKQKGELTAREVLKLALQIAKALEVLESHNYIHRDIKNNNIFVDVDGDFKLGDFGTARVLSQDGIASTKVGTANYMAPEVYLGTTNYDQTVDIYSLGIVLYRCMNKQFLPFSVPGQKSDAALKRRMNNEPMPSPCNADPMFGRIILKCCAFKPEDRYQNATELISDLETYRHMLRASESSRTPLPVNPVPGTDRNSSDTRTPYPPPQNMMHGDPAYRPGVTPYPGPQTAAKPTVSNNTNRIQGGQAVPTGVTGRPIQSSAPVQQPGKPPAAAAPSQKPVTNAKKPKKRRKNKLLLVLLVLLIAIVLIAAILVVGSIASAEAGPADLVRESLTVIHRLSAPAAP